MSKPIIHYAKIIFCSMITAALVFTCMWLIFQSLFPSLLIQADETIIPKLNFEPRAGDTSLIWIKRSGSQSSVDNLLNFLEAYYYYRSNTQGRGLIKHCSYSDVPTGDEICEIDVREWEECTKEHSFGYQRSSPCIFLWLNKIYGWTPDYYIYDHELPPEMPKQLKDHISNISNIEARKNVWVSCEGYTPADKEHIGSTTYYPKSVQGFPAYYFPYLNKQGYWSPLVAIKFERPASGVVINVECRAWAKNIKYSRDDGSGSVHFELLVD